MNLRFLCLITALAAVTHSQLAHALDEYGNTPPPASIDVDIKKYSYVCLEANQDRCLGISPGKGLPYFDPNNLFELQVKNRLNNEYKGDDYKKNRWDVNFETGMISLSRFSDLCVGKHPNLQRMFLYRCSTVKPEHSVFNLTFNTNVNMAGSLQLAGTDYCATVMKCQNGGKTFCDSESNIPVTGGEEGTFSSGAYVKFRPCHWTALGSPDWKAAQTWRQRLDCAVGCSPFLQYNDVCDQACANEECEFDSFNCITPAPTPPTPLPTRSPTLPTPLPTTRSPTTGSPTTAKPTQHPTTRTPTTSKPTKAPSTGAPTTKKPTKHPTLEPTKLPTKRPSRYPSVHPTHRPSRSPTTLNPTMAPTNETLPVLNVPHGSKSPTASPTEGEMELSMLLLITLLPVLILLCLVCCLFCCIMRNRRRKDDLKDPSNWQSSLPENKLVFEEFRKQKADQQRGGGCCFCCARSRSRKDSTASAISEPPRGRRSILNISAPFSATKNSQALVIRNFDDDEIMQ